MKSYIDELYCDHCDKDTSQRVYDSGHERDSSNDRCECLECGWIKYGLTGEYQCPYIEEREQLLIEIIQSDEESGLYQI